MCKHGLINYKDTKTKCRLYWRLIQFIDWRKSQSCWYFRNSFMNYCPTNFLSCSPPPSLPPSQSQVQYVLCTQLYRQCGCMGGGGVLSCVGDHILQKCNTLYLTRFRTYKIALPPQTKPWRRGGLRQINTCRKSFTG